MKFNNQDVKQVFEGYPPLFRKKLKSIRKLIFELEKTLPEVEGLDETLNWGEPSYRAKKKGVGTTVRIHWLKSRPNQFGIYFNCQTTLISKYKKKYPGMFKYEGKRAIIFDKDEKVPSKEIQNCISMALTYHLDKKRILKAKK